MTPETPHSDLTEALREDLALYAFGLLEREQAAEIERHLESGCRVCRDELRSMEEVAVELAPRNAPSPELKDRLTARIRRDGLPQEPAPGLLVYRAGTGGWRATPWSGVSYRRLYQDTDTGMVTTLVRIDPGARYPAHRHHGTEQSWVLEGSCRIGAVTIRAGDFAVAAAGTVHEVLESDEGCLLLMVSSARDEILA